MLQYNPTVSGSLIITGSLTVTNGVIGTISGVDIQIFSSSINQVISGIQVSTGSSDAKFQTLSGVTSSALTRLTNIETKSASVDISISNINSITASNIARLSNLETKSSSVDISITNINSFTSSNANTSLNTYTGSNDTKFTTLATYTGSLDTKNTTLSSVTSSLISKTGSYATTGSNTFYGTQVFSGSVYVANDLIVQGSSSIQYISASSVSIGTNIVNLNTANPVVRFGGLSVIDSGSASGKSGSFIFDSRDNEWIFVHQGTSTVTSSTMITGPETYNSLGDETHLTDNIIPKSLNGFHIIDSCLFDNGTTTCVKNNLIGTGTITGTTIYGSTAVCSAVGLFSGCVGIGCTTPGTSLTIQSTGVTAYLKTTATADSATYGNFQMYRQACKVGNGVGFALGLINSAAVDTEYAYIGTLIESCTSTQECGAIGFYTTTAGTQRCERLRITSAGNVGIGTTSPIFSSYAQLTVKSSTAGGIVIQGGATDYSRLFFAKDDTSNAEGLIRYYHSDNSMQFWTAATERMRITSGGNVGIGTTSPTSYSGFTTLNINNATNGGLIDLLNNGTRVGTFFNTASDVNIGSITSVPFIFYTANTERMRISTCGGVGIGVTPCVWYPAYQKGLMLASGATLFGYDGDSTINHLSANFLICPPIGNEIRLGTGGATNLYQYNGTFTFRTAGYGTGGSAIAWCTAMYISCYGSVGIGTTSTSTEANLFLGAQGTSEGGQLVLQKGTSQNCATHLDNYTDRFRVMAGTNTASASELFSISMNGGDVTTYGRLSTIKQNGGGTYKQTVVGQTTAASSGTAKKIAYVGHTHSIRVYLYIAQDTSNVATGIADFTTAYGASSGGITASVRLGNISSISATYDNGGSPTYTINVSVAYTGAAPTINYVIEGINYDNNIYTIA